MTGTTVRFVTISTATVKVTFDWDAESVRQAGWNLFTPYSVLRRGSLDMTYPGSDGYWFISIYCNPAGRNPRLEPQTLDPQPCLEVDPEDRQKNAKQLIDNLKRMKVSEFKDSYEDGFGAWTIIVRWSGTLVNDPRWPVNAERTVQ
jgi:hypothetical protein